MGVLGRAYSRCSECDFVEISDCICHFEKSASQSIFLGCNSIGTFVKILYNTNRICYNVTSGKVCPKSMILPPNTTK